MPLLQEQRPGGGSRRGGRDLPVLRPRRGDAGVRREGGLSPLGGGLREHLGHGQRPEQETEDGGRAAEWRGRRGGQRADRSQAAEALQGDYARPAEAEQALPGSHGHGAASGVEADSIEQYPGEGTAGSRRGVSGTCGLGLQQQ